MITCSTTILSDTGIIGYAWQDFTAPAGRPYTCCECGRVIDPGEAYHHDSGVFDGQFQTHRTCIDCFTIREVLFEAYVFKDLWDDVEAEIDQAGMIPEDCLAQLTKPGRDRICEMIEALWDEDDDE